MDRIGLGCVGFEELAEEELLHGMAEWMGIEEREQVLKWHILQRNLVIWLESAVMGTQRVSLYVCLREREREG